MAQQAAAFTGYTPHIWVEKGIREYEIAKLKNIAWHIAYTALWNTAQFSANEKETALNFISSFLSTAASPQKGYAEFVQRILLARQYTATHPGTYIPLPSLWFSTKNKNGFAGTAAWLQSVNITRSSLPNFKIHLRAFAEAIEETVESGAAKDFHYWRSWFAEHEKQSLLNLFLSTVANYQNRLLSKNNSAPTPVMYPIK